ncbi:MAG: PorT family protein [Bacteroidetes bacterium]|nr:PorT family protein [Bacteroidota bacterium]
MRILVITLLAFCSLSIQAQQLEFGIELGSNIIPNEKTQLGRTFLLAPHAGLNASYSFSDKLSLNSGLFFSQLRQRREVNEIGNLVDELGPLGQFGEIDLEALLGIPGLNLDTRRKISNNYRLNYLQIPLHIQYGNENLQVFAGAYVNILTTVRTRRLTETVIPLLQSIEIDSLDPSGTLSFFLPEAEDSEYTESSNTDLFNRLDAGATLGMGYRFNDLQLRLSYSYGFMDFLKDSPEGTKTNQQFARISLVYWFLLAEGT